MEISTAIVLAIVLMIALWVPFYFWSIRRGRAHGHTWFTWWKPRGHSDIGDRRRARGSLLRLGCCGIDRVPPAGAESEHRQALV